MTIPSSTDDRTDIGDHIRRAYTETLRETVTQALQDGYDGVDVVHVEIQFVGDGAGLDVWRAKKWTEEPPTIPTGRGRRYDFRYYDREALLDSLERGEWPETVENGPR